MKNKIVLITGSTDGIGKETALQLAQRGATVIVHGRSVDRCQAACDDIRRATGNSNVDFVVADLSSQRQVRRMAAEIQERTDRLHVLINNAGVIVLDAPGNRRWIGNHFCRQSSGSILADSLAARSVEGERARAHH